MTENTGIQPAAEADPLAEDVSGIDTSFPLLEAGVYNVEVFDAVKQENKAKNGEVIKISLRTTTDATGTKGEALNKGFPLYDYISLTPTPGGDGKNPYTGKDIAKKIAQVSQAMGITGVTARQIADDPKAYWVGKIVCVKIGIAKETADFPESNRVKQYVPIQ